MSRSALLSILAATSAAAFASWLPASASAQQQSLQACGNIRVEANAMCKVRVDAECRASCEDLSFRAACSAELYAECKGQCTGMISASCTGSCQSDCMAQCQADPGEFDCSAYCQARAEGKCEARCGEMPQGQERDECMASCEATFTGECRTTCEAEPPSASCEARCTASCDGHCMADANLDCQVDCQTKSYADCRAELQGSCMAQCDKPEGQLFCEGEYVDHGDNLQMCIDALKEAYGNVEVDASASGSSECMGGKCEAEGEAKASANCTVSPAHPEDATFAILLIGLVAFLRRRNP